jgi:signal transduction histidine kinase
MSAATAAHRYTAILVPLLLVTLLTCPPLTRGQSADSIRALISQAPADSSLVLLLNTLAQKLSTSNPAEAFVHARDALALARELAWRPGRVKVLNTLGALHTNAGAYEKALTLFQECLEICRDSKDASGTALALRNIGVVQRRIGNLAEALEYTQRSLDEASRASDTLSAAAALVNLGNIENQQGRYEKALSYFSRARPLFQQRKNRFGESSVLNGMAIAYASLGRLTEALRMYESGLRINEERGDLRAIASIQINIGDIHMKRGDWQAAIRTFTGARDAAESIDAKDLSRFASRSLAESHAAVGNYRQAYGYYAQYAAISDSLFNEEVLHQINARTQEYETREREQQIALLEAETKLQQAQLGREELIRNISIAGLILLALFLAWVYYLARRRKQANAELREALAKLQRTQEQLVHTEKMATLGRISAGIAHEILNPLNFIVNFAELSRDILEEDSARESPTQLTSDDRNTLHANIEKITTYGRRAEDIVSSMVQHAEGRTGVPEPTDVNAILRQTLGFARRVQQAEQIDLPYSLDLSVDSSVGKALLIQQEFTRVIMNLHRNAVESLREKSATVSTSFDATIAVSTQREGDSAVIRFRDNGLGIPAASRSHIFEPFYTTRDSGRNTGLGLSISYDIIVEGHGGTITVESTEGEYAEFIITLPLHKY